MNRARAVGLLSLVLLAGCASSGGALRGPLAPGPAGTAPPPPERPWYRSPYLWFGAGAAGLLGGFATLQGASRADLAADQRSIADFTGISLSFAGMTAMVVALWVTYVHPDLPLLSSPAEEARE